MICLNLESEATDDKHVYLINCNIIVVLSSLKKSGKKAIARMSELNQFCELINTNMFFYVYIFSQHWIPKSF